MLPMAEVVGLAASVIPLTQLVFSVAKFLDRTLTCVHDVAKIRAYVETLSGTFQSIKQELQRQASNAALPEEQKSNLRKIERTLEPCYRTCNALKEKLDRLTRHSTDSHTSLFDRLNLQFHEREITALQNDLERYKSLTDTVLNFSNL